VPGSPGNVSTHFLNPDDVTIVKGGTVTFVVNGGAHGVAIHEVDKKTTRADIAAGLCDGNNNENGHGHETTDRIARSATCNAAAGTANQNFVITDAKGDVIIEPGVNVSNSNPRLDDPS
jgi:plastocyanin